MVNCDDPSAGASPAPTDTVDMHVPSVASTISTSRVGADSSVGVYPAPTTTVAGLHVATMNSCSTGKSSPTDTVRPCVSTISLISPTNVESCVGVSPAPTTVVETLDSSLSSTPVDLDHDSASDEDFIFSDSAFFYGIGFVHRVQDQSLSSWPMIPQSRAISKCTSSRFSTVSTSATASALERHD